MCGLAAFFEPGRVFFPAFLDQVDRDLEHRGPDAGGRHQESGMALVHRRLSILDVREGADQPMYSSDGDLLIVYNGEIYNFSDLRKELESSGVCFRTTSDTEVILEGYRMWGEGVLQRLQGMYAFVIIDRARARAIAVRDPLGIKPLYMRRVGGMVGFASEMRPLLRLATARPDEKAMAELIQYGWAAGTVSNVDGIDRLSPGSIVRVSLKDGTIEQERYFDLLDTIRPGTSSIKNQNEAIEYLEGILQESVQSHLISDVGYTVQLSGGVDSSLIAALAARNTSNEVETFGIDLGDLKENERKWREMVVSENALSHHEIGMDKITFADNLQRAVHHMEGPVPHGGCVFLMLLCDRIRKHSKVVLTGEGADEFFGGYDRYGKWQRLKWQEIASRLLPTGVLPNKPPFIGIKRLSGKDAAVNASVYGDTGPLWKLFPTLRASYGARESANARFHDFRGRLLAVDQTAYLESLLIRQDKMAMAASVEARVPFVHLPLVEAANALSHNMRIPGGETKPILKRIAEKYLPRDVIYRRKIGLTLPYADWCADPKGLGQFVDSLADSDSCLSDYAEVKDLRTYIDRFRSGQAEEKRYMFRLINLELWLRSLKSDQQSFQAIRG